MDERISMTLPSKCLPYDGIEPGSITVRMLKGSDEQNIARLAFDNVSKRFLFVLRDVVAGIDPKDLTLGDAHYIMMWLAINNYSNMYPVVFECEHCNAKLDISVDMNTINVEELSDEFSQPKGVQVGDRLFKLRLATLHDQMEIFNYTSGGKKDGYLYGYARCIVDESDPITRMVVLADMGTKDFKKIKEFFEENQHGPDMMARYKCTACEGEGRVLIPFRLAEFL
jgi:hypothetical protein